MINGSCHVDEYLSAGQRLLASGCDGDGGADGPSGGGSGDGPSLTGKSGLDWSGLVRFGPVRFERRGVAAAAATVARPTSSPKKEAANQNKTRA